MCVTIGLYKKILAAERKEEINITLLVQGNRTDSWKYNDKIDEVATKLALKYFAIVNFVLLPYDEFEEKKSWYGYFKNIDKEGVKLYG